jgi:O-antigen/teichoic acid export membrane protein
MQLYRELASATRSLDLPHQSVRSLLRQWSDATRHILLNATSLVGATAVTSGLGFVYWWLAARRFPPASVGFAAASVSAMMLLGTMSMLGLGTLLIGELPRRPGHQWPLITAALLVAGTTGAVVGALAAVVAPAVSMGLRPLASSIGSVGLFAVGVSLTAIVLVLDHSLIGLLRGHLQFGRNVAFAMTKLAALALVGVWWVDRLGLTIYATWVLGLVVSLVGAAVVITARGGRAIWHRPQVGILNGLRRAALAHHGLNLALDVAPLALPLVVTFFLGVTMNAYFYTAWMITSFVTIVPLALTLSLYAVSAAAPAELTKRIRLTLGLAVVVGVLANVVLLIGASQILSIYGFEYAAHASWSLRILGLGVFPVIIKNHFVAIRRVQARVTGAALAMGAGSLLEVAMAALGAMARGLPGLCIGWVSALCIEAALAAPTVYRVTVPAKITGLTRMGGHNQHTGQRG